ncbi:hypothetical protein HFX_0329 [Haloferax mediterranei ATCC 33500]|uniref:Uncharacterized protein n=1 Tax=Haloferax mediterranei (strain ATCC 33500 / DSM 1411 / JCM 8866 / NBRC 14739 / NCIMB 2177 / R-4) TaxID=523841 RepID=I3R1F8_HALMT|nr:hypothetical protein HFX_0329 [Haloferax mediterranei ATCC 33500]
MNQGATRASASRATEVQIPARQSLADLRKPSGCSVPVRAYVSVESITHQQSLSSTGSRKYQQQEDESHQEDAPTDDSGERDVPVCGFDGP